MKRNLSLLVCTGILAFVGCTRRDVPAVQATGDVPAVATPASETAPAVAPEVMLPAGARIRLRLLEALDTRRDRPSDRFTASLVEPLVVDNRVMVPVGTVFTGRVVTSKPSGRLKGRAVLAMSLESFELNGQNYSVHSNNSARVSKGHKKHNFLWIGGGSGGGAAIGAIAGGGAGALIGAGAGAAAGTVGSAVTGKRNVYLPVETPLTFTLKEPVRFEGAR